MVLEITAQGLIAFGLAAALLVMFSTMDIKTRRVPNDIVAMALMIGLLTGVVTGHLLNQIYLHLVAISIAFLFTIPLFYRGAIGGADAKTVLLVACISPGFEFGQLGDVVFEGILGVLVPLLVMFIIGILYRKKQVEPDDRPIPLIPFLLVGYLLVQLLAFI